MTTTPARYRGTAGAPARRTDPFTEFQSLQEQMAEIFGNIFQQPQSADGAPVWAPAADIEEEDDAYILELEVPGVRREDVNIELRQNEVRISGEIKQKERTGVLRRRTRRTGQFQYVVTLPGEIDPDQVDADLHNGVLTVRLGKATKNQPRQISVRES
ncbi:Hsp20/alpha crystallin family protein [Actinoplanes sp. NPDC051411]|uniref:Hsp20/alpha crystallin family protein n=1 Tax=Actinoplanes sp. NPDC051411 TaxID=3155522 RepID=UPI003433052A